MAAQPGGQPGFRPGPQGQYQNQPQGQLPPGYKPKTYGGAGAGEAGALGGGGRLGLGSNVGIDTIGDRTMGGFGGMAGGAPPPLPPPGGAGNNPLGGAGMGRGPLGPVTTGAGVSPLTAMPETTSATHVPPEPAPVVGGLPDAGMMAQDMGGGGFGTGGPLTPNPRPPGGYTGAGGRQFGRVMPGSGGPGPLRRG